MSHQGFNYKELIRSGKLNRLADDASSFSGHDHSEGTGGTGKKLDWDLVWATDPVHDHSSDDKGRKLDWDLCWSDAVHNHSTGAEGGQLTFSTCLIKTYHRHHSNGSEGGKLNWNTCWADCVHDHSEHSEGGQISASAISGEITTAKIDDLAIGGSNTSPLTLKRSKLKIVEGSEVLHMSESWEDYTLPGGEYGFWPQIRTWPSYPMDAVIATSEKGWRVISNVANISLRCHDENWGVWAKQYYIGAS